MRRIFSKLGVSSRAQVVRALDADGGPRERVPAE
jgi:hypothetical protein